MCPVYRLLPVISQCIRHVSSVRVEPYELSHIALGDLRPICPAIAHLTERGIKLHPVIVSEIPIHRFHTIQHLIDRVGTLHQCPSVSAHATPEPCIVTELKNPLGKGLSVTRSHDKSRFSLNDHVRN